MFNDGTLHKRKTNLDVDRIECKRESDAVKDEMGYVEPPPRLTEL
jgi:hypothetical protein